jgi:hypothetical protein
MSQQGSIAAKENAPERVASVTCPVTSSSNAQEGPRQAVSAAKMVNPSARVLNTTVVGPPAVVFFHCPFKFCTKLYYNS